MAELIRSHKDDSNGVYGGGDPIFSPANYSQLQRLRAVVAKIWPMYFDKRVPYSDREADKIIAAIAPKTREEMIAKAINGRRA